MSRLPTLAVSYCKNYTMEFLTAFRGTINGSNSSMDSFVKFF